MIASSPAQSLTGLDTNVILRAILDDDSVQCEVARSVFRGLSREHPGFITSVTLAEVYWTLARRSNLTKADRLRAIRNLIETDILLFDDDDGVLTALAHAEAGADFADALIHETMQQFGATRMVTFDKDAARRFGWELLSAR